MINPYVAFAMASKTHSRRVPGFLIVADSDDREPGAKRLRYRRAPKRDLSALLRAARRDPEVSRLVLALLNAVLGGADRSILGARFELHFLPERLRWRAQRLLRLSVRPNRPLNEVLVARARLGERRLRLLAQSPRGQHARALVQRADDQPRVENTPTPGAAPVPIEVLPEYRGAFVTEQFLRWAAALGTEVIFSNGCTKVPNGRLMIRGTVVVALQHGSVINNVHVFAGRVMPRAGRRVFGELHAFTAMGMEGGHAWAVIGDEGELYFPAQGDYLVVYADEREADVRWKGRIDPDTSASLAKRGPEWLHPQTLGWWVCWIQRNGDPDTWACLFFQRPALRACLVRRALNAVRR
ncbi:MAG: hypothetical protein IAE82_06525 [Opitutaceae bacterium]|nr:hypothetical protein [Opitutaceae bacterium]